MKIKYYFLLATLALSANAAEPERLTELRLRYNDAIERVSKPIETKYVKALKDMQKQFMKRGDLDGANAINDELEKYEKVKSTKNNVKQLTLASLKGEWNVLRHGRLHRTNVNIDDKGVVIISDGNQYNKRSTIRLIDAEARSFQKNNSDASITTYILSKNGKELRGEVYSLVRVK